MAISDEALMEEILDELQGVSAPDVRGEYLCWCCFLPDGECTPPHQPNLNASECGYICHEEKVIITNLE